jgi:hypothetical protein
MSCALIEVVREGSGCEISKRQSLAMLRSPGQQNWLGEDRSHRLISHRPVKVELCQGVGLLPQCTTTGGGQGLAPLYTGSLPW